MPKPSDLYVSVIDLFAILLPGAALVAALVEVGATRFFAPVLPPLPDAASRWVAFALAAYGTGHLVFPLASLLDEVYERLKRRLPDKLKAPRAEAAARALRDRALETAEAAAPMNTYSWSKATLMQVVPAAAADVHRLEADQKFFRSISLVLLIVAGLALADGAPMLAAFVLAMSLACFVRYVEQRAKTIAWTYRHVIVHAAQRDGPFRLVLLPPRGIRAGISGQRRASPAADPSPSEPVERADGGSGGPPGAS